VPKRPKRRTSGDLQRVNATRVDRRAASSIRGYDADWRKLRERHADAHPVCLHCLRNGIVTPMHEVDHIIPFAGKSDPLRLDPGNLQSLCRSCHARKTAADGRATS
jgi:5-methylcytosine-specific restriction protein A